MASLIITIQSIHVTKDYYVRLDALTNSIQELNVLGLRLGLRRR
jgi:hypothetical protein